MPKINLTTDLNIVAGGGTINLDTNSATEIYIIKGTATMLANLVIQPLVTVQPLVEGMTYIFKWQAVLNITTNTTHVFVFGTELSQEECNKQSTIVATYDGSAWVVRIMPDFEESGFISQNKLNSFQEVLNYVVDFAYPQTLVVYLPFSCKFKNITIWVTKDIGNIAGILEIKDALNFATILPPTTITANSIVGTFFTPIINYNYIVNPSTNLNSRILNINSNNLPSTGTINISIILERT